MASFFLVTSLYIIPLRYRCDLLFLAFYCNYTGNVAEFGPSWDSIVVIKLMFVKEKGCIIGGKSIALGEPGFLFETQVI